MSVAEILSIGSQALDIIEKLPKAKAAVEELFAKERWQYADAKGFLESIESRFKTFLNTGEKGQFILYFHWSYSKQTHDNSKTTWFYIWTHNDDNGFSMKWDNVPSMKNQDKQQISIFTYLNSLIENGIAMKSFRTEDNLRTSDTWNGVIIQYLLHVK